MSRLGAWVVTFCLVLLSAGCGGGSSSPDNPSTSSSGSSSSSSSGSSSGTATYSLISTVSGLNSSGLVLAFNGSNVSVPSGATSVTLGSLPAGADYSVTVAAQPSGEYCMLFGGAGAMPSADVTNISVWCTPTVTIGGSITGLGMNSGLVLLNNEGLPLYVSAGATSFTMPTAITVGAPYDISVGSQPNGHALYCTTSNASGTANSNVTTVAVTCTPLAASWHAAANFFAEPANVAVDRAGDVFVVDDVLGAVKEIPFSGGSYGSPLTVATFVGFNCGEETGAAIAVSKSNALFVAASCLPGVMEIPFSAGNYGTPISILTSGSYNVLTMDGSGDVFVANIGGGSILEIPFSNGSYGAPVTIAQRLGNYMAADAAGNLFVAAGGGLVPTNGGSVSSFGGSVVEIPFSNGSYGSPVTIASSVYYEVSCLGVDAADDVFVCDTELSEYYEPTNLPISYVVIEELPFIHGSYGAPVTIGQQLPTATASGLALDSTGDLFLTQDPGYVLEIPLSEGTYGSASTIGRGFDGPGLIGINAAGDVLVSDEAGRYPFSFPEINEIPFAGGAYGTAAVVAQQADSPASDAAGDLFFSNGSELGSNGTVQEAAFVNGSYDTPTTIASGLSAPGVTAVDASGNVFVAAGVTGTTGSATIDEIPLSQGVYGTPIVIASGFNMPSALELDATGNVFVADPGSKKVTEIPFSNGSYGAPVVLAADLSDLSLLKLDSSADVFVSDGGTIKEIPFGNGGYGAIATLASGFALSDFIIDSAGNLFLTDLNDMAGLFQPSPQDGGRVWEIPFSNGSYGAAVMVGVGFKGLCGLGLDAQGRLYAMANGNLWRLSL